MAKSSTGVLQVIHGDAFGGVESWLVAILPIISDSVKLKILICDKNIHPTLLKTFEKYQVEYLHIAITGNVFSYYKQLWDNKGFFRNIDFVHFHIYFKSILSIPFFKFLKKTIILHNHSAATLHIKKWQYRIILNFLKYLLNLSTTIKIAVSEKSYQDLFKGQVPKHLIIPCGVSLSPINEFISNVSKRSQVKRINQLSLLHIGRFYESPIFENAKNQSFLVDILVELQLMAIDFEMLFVGEGDKTAIQDKVECLNLTKRVRFLAYTSDKDRLFATTDIFLFPSNHEGYGMSLVEAQLAGCKCCVSGAIPDEAIFSENVKKIDLATNPKVWATALLSMKDEPLKNDYNENIHYASLVENANNIMSLYGINHAQ